MPSVTLEVSQKMVDELDRILALRKTQGVESLDKALAAGQITQVKYNEAKTEILAMTKKHLALEILKQVLHQTRHQERVAFYENTIKAEDADYVKDL